ncbi:MAG: hypothetical protein EA396_12650 [Anaerolineaceae bacterium]|nr:MAG: hypothetical protein EA396_12650 [Anaerolineaceae bacterium]
MVDFRRRLSALLFIFAALTLTFAPARAQISDIISIEVESAGFDGQYRPDVWTPLKIRVTNRGGDFSGQAVVRPQTTTGISNTYSVALPDVARPVAPATETTAVTHLYMIGDGGELTVRVELINDEGRTVASTDAFLRDLHPRDALSVVIPPQVNLNLRGLSAANYAHHQAGWTPDDIPERAGSLSAVDLIVIGDADTANLSAARQRTLRAWVQNGGHLILTGGGNVGAMAGLLDLSPVMPSGTITWDDFDALADFIGTAPDSAPTLITAGDVGDGGRVLAGTDDVPLVVRHEIGGGTVDFLAFSPTLAPFNTWDGMSELWRTLVTSARVLPGWAGGFNDWAGAQTAVEILPGIDLLPSAWSLVAFLLAYIVLIGPVNYLILARLNRRGYAWVTIPTLIAVFSVLAYTVGFELRGDVVTISRLNVVQAWPEREEAQVDQVIGLLAPRRGLYTLALDDARLLRPLGDSGGFAGLGGRTDNIEIRQSGSGFQAVDFAVDASFLTAFGASGVVARPAISGAVTVIYDGDGNPTLRGFVRNDSGLILQNPVILTSGFAYALGDEMAGNMLNFDTGVLNISVREPATASRLEYLRGGTPISGFTTSSPGTVRGRIVRYALDNADAILHGQDVPGAAMLRHLQTDAEKEMARRDIFLRSVMNDQFLSTGRGDRVFMVGWTNEPVLPEVVTDRTTREVNTTLYIIELERTVSTGGAARTITQDQFTWTSMERDTILAVGPVAMAAYSDIALSFRFTPLPSAVLNRVDELTLILERSAATRTGGLIEVWDWSAGEWVTIRFDESSRITLDDHQRFLGPLNAVQVRTVPRDEGGAISSGTPTLSRIGVEQSGR